MRVGGGLLGPLATVAAWLRGPSALLTRVAGRLAELSLMLVIYS